MKIKIPNKIKIFDQVVRVKFDNEYCNANDVLGQSNLDHNKIILCDEFDEEKLPKSMIEKVFFHELSHFIIWMIKRGKTTYDEVFVDNLSTILYNIMSNNKFHEEEKNENKTEYKRQANNA